MSIKSNVDIDEEKTYTAEQNEANMNHTYSDLKEKKLSHRRCCYTRGYRSCKRKRGEETHWYHSNAMRVESFSYK